MVRANVPKTGVQAVAGQRFKHLPLRVGARARNSRHSGLGSSEGREFVGGTHDGTS
jgi:hypothetical protein